MNNLKTKFLLMLCYVGITTSCILSAPSAFADIVKNGDFSSGTAFWTTQNTTVYQNMGVGGSDAMQTACAGHQCVSTAGSGAYFSQLLDTVAGTNYTLSFVVGETDGPTGEFSFFWDGAQQADVLNPASGSIDFRQNPGLVAYRFDLVATSASTLLEFHGRQDPGRMSFDNVSLVEKTSAVPEPASIALVGLGLMAVMMTRRKSGARTRN